jgi:hypothetical protein
LNLSYLIREGSKNPSLALSCLEQQIVLKEESNWPKETASQRHSQAEPEQANHRCEEGRI